MATLSWRLLLHTMLRVWLVAFRDQKPAAISSPASRPGQSSQANMGMVVVGGAGQHLEEDHRSPPFPLQSWRQRACPHSG